MKNQALRKVPFLCIFIIINLFATARAQASAVADTETHLVTATEYADFLNHVASSDADHLYDQKMSSDTEAACIQQKP